MSTPPDELLDEIADAWANEWDRWLYRDATWLPENAGRPGHEVCRADDSGFAGEFSEVHRYRTSAEAQEALSVLRDRACARRVLGLADRSKSAGLSRGDG